MINSGRNSSNMFSEDENTQLKNEVIVNAICRKKQRTRGNPIAKYFQRLKMVIIQLLLKTFIEGRK